VPPPSIQTLLPPAKGAPLDHPSARAPDAAVDRTPVFPVRIEDGPDAFPAAVADLFCLQRRVENGGGRVDERTVAAVRDVMIQSPLADRRQGLFLFRETAGLLAALMVHGSPSAAGAAYRALHAVLKNGRGFAHRTAAEALGGLPHGIRPPDPPPEAVESPVSISWERLMQKAGAARRLRPVWKGRSLVAGPVAGGRVLVCKMARRGERGGALAREVHWMSQLRAASGSLPVRFDVPEPLLCGESALLQLAPAPRIPGNPGADVDPSGVAVAFVAHVDYFRYPNGAAGDGRFPRRAFCRMMAQNAFLLGRLAAAGILHTAPIPLFHNRVQVHRRRDGGCYEWYRAGRLDRWLASCAYPNFGPTGLRDFEHLAPLDDGHLSLYRCAGTHFLSLLMVLASYFRNRAPERVGSDGAGAPVDARDLFDPQLMHDTILAVFDRYCEGLAGRRPDFPLPVDLERLVSRMVEEMGLDRHMEEILRKADQDQMSEAAFAQFLKERGGSMGEQKGAADIVLSTGPHLGAFNDTTSLPELIHAVAAFAGLAVAGRFRHRMPLGPAKKIRRRP